MRINQTKCDNCGKVKPQSPFNYPEHYFRTGWYYLGQDEHNGLIIYGGKWDFCSLKCLREWIDKRPSPEVLESLSRSLVDNADVWSELAESHTETTDNVTVTGVLATGEPCEG